MNGPNNTANNKQLAVRIEDKNRCPDMAASVAKTSIEKRKNITGRKDPYKTIKRTHINNEVATKYEVILAIEFLWGGCIMITLVIQLNELSRERLFLLKSIAGL